MENNVTTWGFRIYNVYENMEDSFAQMQFFLLNFSWLNHQCENLVVHNFQRKAFQYFNFKS
jgi:hypothetical protein